LFKLTNSKKKLTKNEYKLSSVIAKIVQKLDTRKFRFNLEIDIDVFEQDLKRAIINLKNHIDSETETESDDSVDNVDDGILDDNDNDDLIDDDVVPTVIVGENDENLDEMELDNDDLIDDDVVPTVIVGENDENLDEMELEEEENDFSEKNWIFQKKSSIKRREKINNQAFGNKKIENNSFENY